MTGKIYLGADAGGTGVKYVLMDRQQEVLHEGELPTDPQSCQGSLGRLAAKVADWLAASSHGNQVLASVGLACAGIVATQTGNLGRSPNLPGWEGSNLRGDLAGHFPGKALVVANDVNAALYGEFRRGAGRGGLNLVMVALGTGVGGAVMIDGRLHLGSHEAGGEIGHMTLDPQGRLCSCGATGCLEAYAGSLALLQRARAMAGSSAVGASDLQKLVLTRGVDLNTRDLAVLAESGNPAAAAIFAEAGMRLGQAVASLINILDPDRVILGGGVMQVGDLILQPCRDQVGQRVLAETSRQIPVVPAELGPHAAAIGAACLAMEGETGG